MIVPPDAARESKNQVIHPALTRREVEGRPHMMIYLLRHGIAAERSADKYPDDDLRPLTARGILRTTEVSRGLVALGLRTTRLWSSPLIRARNTARLAATVLGVSEDIIVESDALRPEKKAAAVLAEIAAAKSETPVMLVGHEPHLTHLASLLIAGNEEAAVLTLKKAGLVGIECSFPPAAGRGALQFLLKPGQLAALGAPPT